VQVDWDVNAVVIATRSACATSTPARQAHQDQRLRPGTVFGDLMAEIDSVKLPADAMLAHALRTARSRACTRPSTSRRARCTAARSQQRRSASGSCFVEDVGRCNAVDAIAGKMWLDRVDGGDKIFYTTGRLTSEMVIKAAQMGIPFLVSRSG
jgi:FdhD protein